MVYGQSLLSDELPPLSCEYVAQMSDALRSADDESVRRFKAVIEDSLTDVTGETIFVRLASVPVRTSVCNARHFYVIWMCMPDDFTMNFHLGYVLESGRFMNPLMIRGFLAAMCATSVVCDCGARITCDVRMLESFVTSMFNIPEHIAEYMITCTDTMTVFMREAAFLGLRYKRLAFRGHVMTYAGTCGAATGLERHIQLTMKMMLVDRCGLYPDTCGDENDTNVVHCPNVLPRELRAPDAASVAAAAAKSPAATAPAAVDAAAATAADVDGQTAEDEEDSECLDDDSPERMLQNLSELYFVLPCGRVRSRMSRDVVNGKTFKDGELHVLNAADDDAADEDEVGWFTLGGWYHESPRPFTATNVVDFATYVVDNFARTTRPDRCRYLYELETNLGPTPYPSRATEYRRVSAAEVQAMIENDGDETETGDAEFESETETESDDVDDDQVPTPSPTSPAGANNVDVEAEAGAAEAQGSVDVDVDEADAEPHQTSYTTTPVPSATSPHPAYAVDPQSAFAFPSAAAEGRQQGHDMHGLGSSSNSGSGSGATVVAATLASGGLQTSHAAHSRAPRGRHVPSREAQARAEEEQPLKRTRKDPKK